MPAPTFVAEYEVSSWTTNTTPKSVSVTTQTNDILVWIGMTRDVGTSINTLSVGTGWTWSYIIALTSAASTCALLMGVAVAVNNETFTLTGTVTSGGTLAQWGFNCLRFSNSNGITTYGSNTPPQTGTPSIGITTTQPNSALVVAAADWNAINGSSRAWLTSAGSFTEQTYAFQSGGYTTYAGYHPDVGAAGAKTVGLSTPSGQKYSIGVVEILGTPNLAPMPGSAAYRKRRALLVR